MNLDSTNSMQTYNEIKELLHKLNELYEDFYSLGVLRKDQVELLKNFISKVESWDEHKTREAFEMLDKVRNRNSNYLDRVLSKNWDIDGILIAISIYFQEQEIFKDLMKRL